MKQIARINLCTLHIKRDIEPYRAGPIMPCQKHRLLKVVGNEFRFIHHHRIFRQRLDDGNDVCLLHPELPQLQSGISNRFLALGLAGDE